VYADYEPSACDRSMRIEHVATCYRSRNAYAVQGFKGCWD